MYVKDIPNYREYYKNYLLEESPYLVQRQFGENLDNLGYNSKTGSMILAKEKDTHNDFTNIQYIDNVKILTHQLDLYSQQEYDIVSDWWLHHLDHYVNAYFNYRIVNNELQSVYAWNWRIHSRGYARFLYVNFYLKHYSAIISDMIHTPEGCQFWQNLIDDCKDKHKITVLLGREITTSKEEPIDLNNIEQYWNQKSASRIKIYATNS